MHMQPRASELSWVLDEVSAEPSTIQQRVEPVELGDVGPCRHLDEAPVLPQPTEVRWLLVLGDARPWTDNALYVLGEAEVAAFLGGT